MNYERFILNSQIFCWCCTHVLLVILLLYFLRCNFNTPKQNWSSTGCQLSFMLPSATFLCIILDISLPNSLSKWLFLTNLAVFSLSILWSQYRSLSLMISSWRFGMISVFIVFAQTFVTFACDWRILYVFQS